MEISEIYDEIWRRGMVAFERGEPQIDPHISDKAGDLRRGITLAFRPLPPVRDAVTAYIERLAKICPGQYFYRPEELHVSVLSIISGTELWEREMLRLEACRLVIDEVLGRCCRFKIHFRGVTAAPNAVMIQGFPSGESLTVMREELRAAFAGNGLGGMLDRRHKVTAAHMTIMRFRQPERDLKSLVAFLKASRETDFGESEINTIQLLFGDWYASAERARLLQEYRLLP